MRGAHLDRRRFHAAAVGAATWLCASALRAEGRPEKRQVAIAVAGRALFYHLPLTIAEQLGYFQAEGLEVQIADFAGGAADVVSGAYEDTILQQNRGRMVQAFVLQGRAPQIAVGVSTRTMPDYRSPADLRGRRIGVTAPGSSSSLVASLVLARAGLRPGDVSFVGVGTTAGTLTAVRSGQVDAVSNLDPVMTLLEQQGDIRVVADMRTLKDTQTVFGGPMPAGCLYAPVEFLQRYPNTVQALANAMVHALKWLQTAGPSDIIKTVPETHLLGDRALYLAAFDKVREAFATDGLMPEEGGRTALRALAGFDATLKAERIDLSRTYTNQFARRAKDRFKA